MIGSVILRDEATRRGAGNRSARRVICIHVRCCLATWQPPGHPLSSYDPIPFHPLYLSFRRLLILPVLLILSLPRLAVRPATLTYVPIDHFARNPSFRLAFPRPPCTETRCAIEIPAGYNKVLLLSRPGLKTKGEGRRVPCTRQRRARGLLQEDRLARSSPRKLAAGYDSCVKLERLP